MINYLDTLNEEIKEYFKILSPNFPSWLLEYINTKEMQRIGKISISCGTDYSNCFNIKYWYSNLEHSVGVALIIWNFTHDKKQTLAGLFHDIATPVFKHCIDFMNGDAKTQESTEEKTKDIIKNSKEIIKLLKRDGIKLEEVCDYKIYPIADNDTPKLSSDRFEYTFSSGLTFFRVWELDKIKKIYNDIIITKNEDGIDELAFKHQEVCEEYIHIIQKLWPEWISDKDRTVMQFIADICKSMNNAGYLTVDDLYTYSEKTIIDKILNCQDDYLKESFKNFQAANTVYRSKEKIKDKYCIKVKAKTRYIIPLVLTQNGAIRINKLSTQAKKEIDEYLKISQNDYYTYFDFDFKPYEKYKEKRNKMSDIKAITIEDNEQYLRQISKSVNILNDKNLLNDIKILENYCEKNEVLAMASVQLGIPKRIIYLKNTNLEVINRTQNNTKTKEDYNYNEKRILINPKIISREGLTEYWEACASCLDNTGRVLRPYKIIIEYYDINNNKYIDTFIGFESTVLSHEMDHLDGILHIDIAEELLIMDQEKRKKFRQTNNYNVISKTGDYHKLLSSNSKKLIKKINK